MVVEQKAIISSTKQIPSLYLGRGTI